MNEATVLLLHHDRNEIMTVTMHYLVETTLMARIDCKRLSSVSLSPSLPLSSSLFALGARVFSYVFCRSIAVFSAAKTLSRSLLADVVIVTSVFSFFSCLR
jgi:hypothetical protein